MNIKTITTLFCLLPFGLETMASGVHVGLVGGSAWLKSTDTTGIEFYNALIEKWTKYEHIDSIQSQASLLFGFYAGYQWDLPGQLSVQTGGKFLHVSDDKNGGSLEEGVWINHKFDYNFHALSDVFLLDTTLIYHPKALWHIAPFASFLMGYSMNQLSNFQATDSNQSNPRDLIFGAGANGNFAYGFAVGIKSTFDFPLNVGLEYDYLSLGEAKFDDGNFSAGGPGFRVETFKMKQSVQAVLLSVDYKLL